MKSAGRLLPQALRMRLIGTVGFRVIIPKTFALMAAHKQAAASRSVSPWIKLQHGIVGGDPTVTFTTLSILAHTPSLKVGHVCCPVTRAKKRRFSDRKRVTEE